MDALFGRYCFEITRTRYIVISDGIIIEINIGNLGEMLERELSLSRFNRNSKSPVLRPITK